MQRDTVEPLVGNGALELTVRESAHVDRLVESMERALRRRLPLSLTIVNFDLRLELARTEQLLSLGVAQLADADADAKGAA